MAQAWAPRIQLSARSYLASQGIGSAQTHIAATTSPPGALLARQVARSVAPRDLTTATVVAEGVEAEAVAEAGEAVAEAEAEEEAAFTKSES